MTAYLLVTTRRYFRSPARTPSSWTQPTLEYYIAHSTRVGGRKHRSDRRANPSAVRPPRGETEKIRAWAIEQGYELSSRGRIPAELEQAYHDAH
ncbi:Lsr2 family DNA-binding protein, partial [Rhodococcus sp. T7]|uniref:Lsr2 family DNA-binding protein n=1 Tax=Rhodococcus sp. T7 TaxID=627444 RepID=UPI0019179B3F